jgi:hypothetical protein
MTKEIEAANGNVSALVATGYAQHILNIRFRLENVIPFRRDTSLEATDPIMRLRMHRYQLYDYAGKTSWIADEPRQLNPGTTSLPETNAYQRRAVAAVQCTPEHARMQKKLMIELEAEYPRDQIRREEDFIDVSVRTADHLILFEIKSDLNPRTVIRQALGQILEYAYHPARNHNLPVKLVIVGRCRLTNEEETYLNRLTRDFNLPIEYRVISL